MGPKPKKPPPPPPLRPEDDPKENVTELEKEFFEYQLADIEKKLSRISTREEEMKAGIIEFEEKIIEYKKEKGAIVDELEQILLLKEEQKCAKREEMFFMADEIKNRIEKHKRRIEECNKKYNDMVAELTETINILEEEIRIIDDYKQNKDLYHGDLDRLEEDMKEAEVQHQRNLFEIQSKLQKAKSKVNKELLARLLSFSIEFREANQQKIGNPCHRVTQENKAIQTVLMLMKMEIYEYETKHKAALKAMLQCKSTKDRKQDKNDKIIARTSIQVYVIKTLRKQKLELLETLKGFNSVRALFLQLQNKLRKVSEELENLDIKIEKTREEMEKRIEDTNMMTEAMRHLRKSYKRLKLLIRNSFKIAEEATAVRLIPMGGLDEEKYLNAETKLRLFRFRRDNVFNRKGNLLKYLLDFMSTAQLTEDDKKVLMTATSEYIDLGQINFGVIYGKAEVEEKESYLSRTVAKQTIFASSMTSLPRSESQILKPPEPKEFEGEFGEFEGEFDMEKEGQKVIKQEPEEFQEDRSQGEESEDLLEEEEEDEEEVEWEKAD